ncbi:MAG: ribonuclease PH [Hydrogenophilus thermoluteolus]
MSERVDGRAADVLRPVTITPGVAPYAEGSALIALGNTRVLCTASVEARVPPHRKESGGGWVTAEYGMLPRATHTRSEREAVRGKQSGRTQEIQRLIGRSLRMAVDLDRLGPRQIILDCDVLQADGGTRCAAITGGWVALALACDCLVRDALVPASPLVAQIAAVSVGVVAGVPLLDLAYEEDSRCTFDMNVVMNERQELIEIQGTAEGQGVSRAEFMQLLTLAEHGIEGLIAAQRAALQAAGVALAEECGRW